MDYTPKEYRKSSGKSNGDDLNVSDIITKIGCDFIQICKYLSKMFVSP